MNEAEPHLYGLWKTDWTDTLRSLLSLNQYYYWTIEDIESIPSRTLYFYYLIERKTN